VRSEDGDNVSSEARPPTIQWRTLSVTCADADATAHFYSELLGWDINERGDIDPDTGRSGWVTLRNPTGDIALAFGAHDWYQPPVWPERPGEQTMMMHFEIAVDDVPASVECGLAAGGTIAPWQSPDRARDGLCVMLDPAGHPLCLFYDGPPDESQTAETP